jgi:hypothetical protein
MENSGLEQLHVDVGRLIDAGSNPASPEARRRRFLARLNASKFLLPISGHS